MIAMPGDSDVSAALDCGRTGDMTHRAIESDVIRSFEYLHFQPDVIDLQDRQRRVKLFQQRFFVSLNPLCVPEAEIYGLLRRMILRTPENASPTASFEKNV